MKTLIIAAAIVLAGCASRRDVDIVSKKPISMSEMSFEEAVNLKGAPKKCVDTEIYKSCHWKYLNGLYFYENNQYVGEISQPEEGLRYSVSVKTQKAPKLGAKSVYVKAVKELIKWSENAQYIKGLFQLNGFKVVSTEKTADLIVEVDYGVANVSAQGSQSWDSEESDSNQKTYSRFLKLKLIDSKTKKDQWRANAESVGPTASLNNLVSVFSFALKDYVKSASQIDVSGHIETKNLEYLRFKKYAELRKL